MLCITYQCLQAVKEFILLRLRSQDFI
jgi:hypothetical protein